MTLNTTVNFLVLLVLRIGTHLKQLPIYSFCDPVPKPIAAVGKFFDFFAGQLQSNSSGLPGCWISLAWNSGTQGSTSSALGGAHGGKRQSKSWEVGKMLRGKGSFGGYRLVCACHF